MDKPEDNPKKIAFAARGNPPLGYLHGTLSLPEEVQKLKAERDALQTQVERLTLDGIHTCHAECQRPICRLTRERNVLLEALKDVLAWGTDENYVRASMACEKARAAIKAAEGEK